LHFRGIYHLGIFGVKDETKQEISRSSEEAPLRCQALSELHDVTTQKTVLFIEVIAMATSNPALNNYFLMHYNLY
jgi:hypothetical protein